MTQDRTTLLAVADNGLWLEGTLAYSDAGRTVLRDLTPAKMAAMRDSTGASVGQGGVPGRGPGWGPG